MPTSVGHYSAQPGRLTCELAVRRQHIGVISADMTGGQAVVVGVGLALILVIALAVAAFVWRQILVRRRTPEEHYRRAVKDVRRVEADLKRHGRARRKAAMAGHAVRRPWRA